MPANHGFARDSEFEFLSKTENSISFILKSNDETLKVYPYDFEFIVTNSEYDALMLENNLIKKHQPHYNILLKDGKNFAYIKLE